MRSVLIVRPGALGDALLTLPLVEALDKAGVSRIGILGTPSSWAFLAPGSIELFDFDGRDWLGLFDERTPLGPLARRTLDGFDAALVLLGRGRERVERALRRYGIGRVAGAAPASKDAEAQSASSVAKVEFVEPAWPPASAHAASRLLCAVEAVHEFRFATDWPPSPTPLAHRPRLRVSRAEIERTLRDVGPMPSVPGGDLAIHPGSGSGAKCWPTALFAK